METAPGSNPDTLNGAPEPAVGLVEVEGTHLYTEVRGTGRPILLIGAADEEAEIYRGIAERLAIEFEVVCYDRRGSGRSGDNDWPAGSTQHADDAAALLRNLDLAGVTVLGASAGGIVALRLALEHPDLLATVLCFEPGVFHAVDGGDAFRLRVQDAVEEHLRTHPDDWSGASDALGRAAVASIDGAVSLFQPPPGKEWFVRRTAAQAESLIRGDLRITGEGFDPDAIRNCRVNLRFSHGTASLPIFGDIAASLAALRGEHPDVLSGMSHSIYYHPDQAAQYITAWSRSPGSHSRR